MKTILYFCTTLLVCSLWACSPTISDVTITGIEVTRYSPIDSARAPWDTATGPDFYVVLEDDGAAPTIVTNIVPDVMSTPTWLPMVAPYTINEPWQTSYLTLMDEDANGRRQTIGQVELNGFSDLVGRPGSVELKNGTTAIRVYLSYE